MKQTAMLTTMSLLSMVLETFHLADDSVRRFEKAQLSNFSVIPIVVVRLYRTLVPAERRSGDAAPALWNASRDRRTRTA